MLHAKFQDHRTSGSGAEDFYFKGFVHIWAWRPSRSCDLDHKYKLSFPFPKGDSTYSLALIDQAVSEEKMFEIVNVRRTDAGRTPDQLVSYKLTGEPSAQVR